MEFGYHYHSFDHEPPIFDEVIERVQWLEQSGFQWVSVMDHLWQIPINGPADEPFFEAYTTLSALAARTDQIKLGTLVTCPLYRNPGLLGKMVTTLDHLSEGRVILGIGAGWAEHEFSAYGYEFPPPPERVKRLEETVELLTKLWESPSPISYDGEYYQLEDVVFKPDAYQDPHPPILIGGGGEKLTLRVVAKHADLWNIPSASISTFEQKRDVLESHCKTVGRDINDIDLVGHHWLTLAEDTEKAHDRYVQLRSQANTEIPPRSDRGLVGTPAEIIELLKEYRALGIESFILKPPNGDKKSLELFVDEVLPEFN